MLPAAVRRTERSLLRLFKVSTSLSSSCSSSCSSSSSSCRSFSLSAVSSTTTTTTTTTNVPPSISFSGAGFLGVYHAGASSYLLSRGLLLPNSPRQTLLGSSAGALMGAGVQCNLAPEATLEIAAALSAAARAAGPLNSLTPGFSLLDSLLPLLDQHLLAAIGPDRAAADGHVRNTLTNLRVYLTPPTPLSGAFSYSSHCYLDTFPDLNILTAACLLSSYVPVGTGPLSPRPGDAVARAAKALEAVEPSRDGKDGEDAVRLPARGLWYDGGLAAMWPTVNTSTLVVSPVSIRSSRNICISPPPSSGLYVPGGNGIEVNVSLPNASAVHRMLHPSTDDEYRKIFESGYEDARRVCVEEGLAR